MAKTFRLGNRANSHSARDMGNTMVVVLSLNSVGALQRRKGKTKFKIYLLSLLPITLSSNLCNRFLCLKTKNQMNNKKGLRIRRPFIISNIYLTFLNINKNNKKT
jgi:hypothetical protein